MLKIDLHFHTIASGHGHNTILEYVEMAKRRKMKIIGVADHAPGHYSSKADEDYFSTLERLPRIINGIKVLRGVEANILNQRGETDLSELPREKLDYTIASFHSRTAYQHRDKESNTKALINLIKSGEIDIVGHPGQTEGFDLDMLAISALACKNNVLLEINLHYLAEKRFRHFVMPNLKEMIGLVKKYKKKVIVNSDAHNIWELGDDSPLKKVQSQIGLTRDLIINNYPKELMRRLKIKL